MPKKGHRTSEETKRKLSEANKGKNLELLHMDILNMLQLDLMEQY